AASSRACQKLPASAPSVKLRALVPSPLAKPERQARFPSPSPKGRGLLAKARSRVGNLIVRHPPASDDARRPPLRGAKESRERDAAICCGAAKGYARAVGWMRGRKRRVGA